MKRAFVIPGLSTDSELHHWSLCGNDMALFKERSTDQNILFSITFVVSLW